MQFLRTARAIPHKAFTAAARFPSRAYSRPWRCNASYDHQPTSRACSSAPSPGGEPERLPGSDIPWTQLRDDSHPHYNVKAGILDKVGKRLLHETWHPLATLKGEIAAYFAERAAADPSVPQFKLFDDFHPVVTVRQNFDELLTPADHVSRSPSDTFYLDEQHLLRCHTSAHQTQVLRAGHSAFLVAGDVYRRDEIDRTHYPVFHQMEGVRVWRRDELPVDAGAAQEAVVQDLKDTLEGLARRLFGDVPMRWVDAYFPFTDPSLELEIFWDGDWLEVLGCGMIEPAVLTNGQRGDDIGWAFGLGLERLAMVLFGVTDIRLFWSADERFRGQFKPGHVTKFEPYSKYPPCLKDVTFWLPDTWHDNDFFDVAREIAGDLVENVECIDDFTHPKTGRRSKCFRVTYRSMDRSLTNEEIDKLQFELRDALEAQLGAELR